MARAPMKAEQKSYLKREIQRLSNTINSYSFPAEEDPPASVERATDTIEKAQKIVDRWQDKERDRQAAITQEFQERLRNLRRSFAFEDPADTLKLCEALAKDVEKHR